MMESSRARDRRARERERPGPASSFGGDAPDPGPVTVAHGPYSESLPVADMTVGEIRSRYRDRFDLHPESDAILDGLTVSDDTTVGTGQMLTFIHRSGEKGL